MDRFSSLHQPDEGYSEAPLDPSPASSSLPALSPTFLSSRPDLQNFQTFLDRLGASSVAARTDIAIALLNTLPTSVVADIVRLLNPRLFMDFAQHLPPEVCLKIYGYLDAVSLVNASRTSLAWYHLTQDPRLWKRLYLLEGWTFIQAEIEAYQERLSRKTARVLTAAAHAGQSATTSRSTVTSNPTQHADHDVDMADLSAPLGHGDETPASQTSVIARSIFGNPSHSSNPGRLGARGKGPASNTASAAATSTQLSTRPSSGQGDVDMDANALAPALPSSIAPAPTGLFHVKDKAKDGRIPEAALRLWVGSSFKVNWRYLYCMRRRLESNWERAKFVNYQIPHEGHPEDAHTECVYSLQFDSQYLVSGSRDWTLRIWNLRTRRLARPPLRHHTGSVLCLQFDASPNQDIIVSGSSDASVVVWRFSTGEVLQVLRAHLESVLNVRFDDRVLVTCSKDKTIKVFNRRPLRYGDMGYQLPAGTDIFSPATIRLRRYGLEPDLRQELPVIPAYTIISELNGHQAAVNAVQVHGRTVVSASGDRLIKIWDWPDAAVVRQIGEHSKGIACVQFDGRRIISGSSDNEIKIFDSATGLEVANLPAHRDLVRTVQAGFGDLPYSVAADEAEARRVDRHYFNAVQYGAVEVPETAAGHQPFQRNAGSSRPELITSYGAKIPPGGGGSMCSRIVSGSYDQYLIIWRRDQDGVWKDQHRLRHSDALTVAAVQRHRYRQTHRGLLSRAGSRLPAPDAPVPDLIHPSALPPPVPTSAHTISTTSGSNVVAPSSTPHPPPIPILSTLIAPLASPPVPSSAHVNAGSATSTSDVATTASTAETATVAVVANQEGTHESVSPPHSITALVDHVVPRGAEALQTTLAHYPTLLLYRSQIDAAISREPSAFTRSQLRQALAAAVLRAQIRGRYPTAAQNAAGLPTTVSASTSTVPVSTVDATPNRDLTAAPDTLLDAQPQTTTFPAVASRRSPLSTTPATLAIPHGSATPSPPPTQSQQPSPQQQGSHDNHHHHSHHHHHHHNRQHQHQHATAGHSNAAANVDSNVMDANATTNATANTTTNPTNTPTVNATANATASANANSHPAPNANTAHGGGGGRGAIALGAPEIRVFKLQFDARQIICCSQNTIIMAWDFCNHDPELEKTARFFGTVE